MNSNGQALIETLILTAIFMLLIAGVAKKLPMTFDSATPYLGAQVESRLQTGVGFAADTTPWSKPINGGKGGIK